MNLYNYLTAWGLPAKNNRWRDQEVSSSFIRCYRLTRVSNTYFDIIRFSSVSRYGVAVAYRMLQL